MAAAEAIISFKLLEDVDVFGNNHASKSDVVVLRMCCSLQASGWSVSST